MKMFLSPTLSSSSVWWIGCKHVNARRAHNPVMVLLLRTIYRAGVSPGLQPLANAFDFGADLSGSCHKDKKKKTTSSGLLLLKRGSKKEQQGDHSAAKESTFCRAIGIRS